MEIADLEATAFAMPLTSPSYPRGSYRFTNREHLVITYRTDPAALAEAVPEPLRPESDLVRCEFMTMESSTGFGRYSGAAQHIPVRLGDQAGGYPLDAQISYKANTEANGFEFGDEFRLDASLQYRLWPRELGAGVPGFLYGVIETNLLHQAKNEIGGSSDPDSGGTKLFLSPGLQYVTKRWVLEAIVQLPVVQDLGGAALEDDFIVRAGFRVNF